MNNSGLEGKRLLILGGTTLLTHVVNTARDMGVYTIVTDFYPQAPAKEYADKAFNISTADIDALADLVKDEKIDGVFAGYDDFNTTIACLLSKRCGLHFYATQEQIDITKNKILFKDTCRKFGVPVVKQFFDESQITFPCVTKPADSYSGKGILICNDKEEFDHGKEYALSFSKSKQFLVEKFMDSRNVECINIDYVLRDGEIKLSAVGDKYVNDEQGNKTPLTAGVLYPSIRQKEYEDSVNKSVIAMFQSLGLKDGTLFIESFYDQEGFHLYEMGYRVGGGQSSILLDAIEGVDYVRMLIQYALTGTMCCDDVWNKVDCHFNSVACGLVVLIKAGGIARIEGVDRIREMSFVQKYTQYYHEGDTIGDDMVGTLRQTFARIHIVCPDMKSFTETIAEIKENLRIYDTDGNAMNLSIVCRKMNEFVNRQI